MAPGFSVSLLTLWLLGAARCSGDSSVCPCPDIPRRHLTKDPPRECRQINSTFRYICVDGYVRQAGTSNRVKCVLKNGNVSWEFYTLKCIVDPKLPKTQTPKSTESTESHNESPGDAVITTRATAAPSSPQMKRDMNSSTPEPGRVSVQTLLYDPVIETKLKSTTRETTTVLKDYTISPPDARTDPVIETKQKSTTRETTTVLKDYTISPPDARTGPMKAATISVVLIVIIIASISIGIILYRRRCRTTSQHPIEEQVPMNPARQQ